MITPKDIDQKVFKRAVRGYDVEDVEQFLQKIAQSYTELYEENLAAKERISVLSDAVKEYKAMEETLQNALAVARRSGEDIEAAAKVRADAMVEDAAREVAAIAYKYEEMKRSVEIFRAKVVSLLDAQLDIIKDYGEIQVEEDVLASVKEIVEKPLREAEEPTQNTEEIPQLMMDAPISQDTQEIPQLVIQRTEEQNTEEIPGLGDYLSPKDE